MLTAAIKEPGIKRIVITSCILAIIPSAEFFATKTDIVYDGKSRLSELPLGPYTNDVEAYAAERGIALDAVEAFVAKHKPVWGVVHIMQGLVLGQNELIGSAQDLSVIRNHAALNPVVRYVTRSGFPGEPVPGTSVHVADVAELHVRALDSRIPGNESYIAVSGGEKGTVWEETFDIVERNFPEEVAKYYRMSNAIGQKKTKRVKVDASRTEEVFGMKFLNYEEQLKSAVQQYVSLKQMET